MKGYTLLTIVLLTLVAGCTYRPIPVATSYPITGQQKMQAAHHWDVLAEHIAGRLKNALDLTFADGAITPAIYIRLTKEHEEYEFGQAFHSLLRSRLVQRGVNVVTNTEYPDTLILDYDVQVVHHKDRRTRYPTPGTFSVMGGLLWLVAYGADNWGDPGLAVVPLAVAADGYALKDYFFPGETDSEVMITTSVAMGQQFVFSETNIYYINTGDFDHYEDDEQTFQVVNQ